MKNNVTFGEKRRKKTNTLFKYSQKNNLEIVLSNKVL